MDISGDISYVKFKTRSDAFPHQFPPVSLMAISIVLFGHLGCDIQYKAASIKRNKEAAECQLNRLQAQKQIQLAFKFRRLNTGVKQCLRRYPVML